jgi:1-acylglycerone phosphate reductase
MGVYSSVKRALEVVSDTLRLELAPLGVSVIAIVTGAVRSQGQTYFKDLALPASSLYKDLEEIFVSRAQGNDGTPRMPTATYAEAVVSEMQKGVSGKFWCGEMAEMVRGSATNVHVPMEAMVSLEFGADKNGVC